MQEFRRLFADSPAEATRHIPVLEAVVEPRSAPQTDLSRTRQPTASPEPKQGKRSAHTWALLALPIAVVASVAAWWALRPAGTPSVDRAKAAAAEVRVAGDDRASPAASPVASPAAAAQPSSPASAPTPGPTTDKPAAPQAFSVLTALQDIVERSDPNIQVAAGTDKTSLVIGKDSLQFRVKSNQAGYLYVFFAGTGKRHFHLLFPNRLDKLNRVEPGVELVLPRKGWEITAGGPAGTNHLVALVSRQERNLARAGLRQTESAIPEFDLAQAERLWKQRAEGVNPFIGDPVCATPDCSNAFGATMLMVDEVAPARARN